MEKVNAMKWLFIYRGDLEVCFVFVCCFSHFFISFKYDFLFDVEKIIVKTREISAPMVKK